MIKIFKGFDKNIINIGTNKPIHIANKELLKQCAESFYEKFGFITRPNEELGSGTILY